MNEALARLPFFRLTCRTQGLTRLQMTNIKDKGAVRRDTANVRRRCRVWRLHMENGVPQRGFSNSYFALISPQDIRND